MNPNTHKIRTLYQQIRRFQRLIVAVDVSAYAAGSAFFIFLSLIPMLIILSSLTPQINLVSQEVMLVSQAVIPEKVYTFIVDTAKNYEGNSMTLVSFSAVVAIWSASKGMLSMIRGLNHVYELKESRNYIMLRLKAIIYTMIFLIAVVLSIAVIITGNHVHLKTLHFLEPVRHILVACIISVVFCTMYCLLPNNYLPWKEHYVGAVFTATIWTLFSFFFSIYIDYLGGFSMYGSLTTVVIVLIWLYSCMYIFFCGALLNRYFHRL